MAQENGPVIISESLQRMALDPKLRLAERLGINWDVATPEDTGRILGFLAAANVLATSIAKKNDRKDVTSFDELTALAALCLWPPNKPPLVEKYWTKIIPAYYDQKIREKLSDAVGPETITMPKLLENGESLENIFSKVPMTPEDYSKEFLDLSKLDSIE